MENSNLQSVFLKNNELQTFCFENKIKKSNFNFTEVTTFYSLCAFQIGKIIECLYLQNEYKVKEDIKYSLDICSSIVQIYINSKSFLEELHIFNFFNSNEMAF